MLFEIQRVNATIKKLKLCFYYAVSIIKPIENGYNI